jgi:hypothetical protein
MGLNVNIDLTVTQAVAILSLLAIVCTLVYQRFFSPISDIPGPFAAIFGTSFQLWHIFKGRSEQAIYDLHRKHGIWPLRIPRLLSRPG